jgi:glycosyltransferase involved in cell wall biosynthesis
MRILLLTQHFDPEPAFRFSDLARDLKKRGHQVQVLTSFPCYPQGRTYPGYRQVLCHQSIVDGISLFRVPQFPDHSRSVLRRALYYLSFALSAATIGLFHVSRADVVLVFQSALPVGFPAWVISRVRRIPYVLDVVDLWPESVAASGMLNNRLALHLIRRCAVFLYHGAARVNVITEGYRRNLIAMGIPDKKIRVIHCWPASGACEPVADDDQFAQREGLAGRFNVVYTGAIGPCQHLDTVLDAAELLSDTPQVLFTIAGEGMDRQRLAERASNMGLPNVRFIGWRNSAYVANMYALCDLLLVHLKPNAMSKVSIPSKTFGYMASGRPVLMAVAGEASDLVRKHSYGIAIPPADAAAMADAIRSFMQLPNSDRRHMGQAARRAYEENYSAAVQVDKVVDALSDVAKLQAA